MGLTLSFMGQVEKELKDRGYKKKVPWRMPAGTRIYEGFGDKQIVVASIEIAKARPESITAAVDEYFEKLREVLQKQLPVSCLHLPGGGDIPLPEWFENWCGQSRILVNAVDEEGRFYPDIFQF